MSFLNKVIVFIFSTVICLHYAFGNVIRDSEIEETIELVISPLKKASGLNDLKIILIDDATPNAFTAGGNNVYVSSGLISEFPDPDVLRGVVAHEIGHITGQHISRRQEVIDNYNKASIAATALGIATAIKGGGAEGLAISIGALHMRDRAVLSYSREFESSADQQALNLLEKSGHSSLGMIKFFEELKIQSNQMFISPYDRTHPLSKDRLQVLKNFNKKAKYSKSQNSKDLQYKFRRIAAKLSAYTKALDKILDCHFEENLDELTHYMKAIKCFRIGNFDDSLNHVNRLLMFNPKDPYYHELKGQIFLESGKKAAIHEYDIAIEQKPNDVLLKLGRAIVGITFYRNDPYGMNNYYTDLIFVIEKEPNNLLALFYASIFYEVKGLKGKSYLNSAKISLLTDNLPNARMMAKAAINELPKTSPDWYKAIDILEMAK